MTKKEVSIRYENLIQRSKNIMKLMDIVDKNGVVIESGSNFVYKISQQLLKGAHISECAIDIDVWRTLCEIWTELRELEKKYNKSVEK